MSTTPNLGLVQPGSGTFPDSADNLEKIDAAIGDLQQHQGAAGRDVQTIRQSVTFLKNTQADFPVTFPRAFVDNNFSVSLAIEFITSPTNPGQVTYTGFVRTADGLTVQVKNISNTDYPGVIHVMAVHD